MYIDNDGTRYTQNTKVAYAEISGDRIVLNVVPTSDVPTDDIKATYCTLYPETATDIKVLNAPAETISAPNTENEKKTDDSSASVVPSNFKECTPSVWGIGSDNNTLRVVISTKGFPFSIAENSLKGLKASGKVASPDGSKSFEFTSEVNGNEIRDNGSTVIVIKKTEGMDLSLDGKWKVSNFKLFK